jgi:uncharacterized protein (DUF302 family)
MVRIVTILFLIITSYSATHAQVTATTGSGELVSKQSNKEASSVTKELKQIIEKRGLQIFGEISHDTEALKAGEKLSFTRVIIFGNPKVGTKLMQCDQQVGYELPLRILITTNSANKTVISFKDPKTYLTKYNLKDCEGVLEKMSGLLHNLTNQVL